MDRFRFRRGHGEGRAPRRPVSYAGVVATLALVLAVGGGTAWATNWIIVSTKQIKPSVLKSLRGNRGPRGFAGTNGANGANGTNGSTGPTGPAGAPGANLTSQTVLPSGESESGVYAVGGGNQYTGGTLNSTESWMGVGITYTQPLSAAIPNTNVIWLGAGANSNCPGPGQAARGYLCLYNGENNDVSFFGAADGVLPAGEAYGAVVWFHPTDVGAYAAGEWTVTAP